MLNQNRDIISSHVEPRPGREQLEIAAEVLGSYQVRLHREREADAQHQEPQRRGQVAHDARCRDAVGW